MNNAREQYSSELYFQFEEAITSDDTVNFLNSITMLGTIVDVGSGGSWYRDALLSDWDYYIGIEPNDYLRNIAIQDAREDDEDGEYCCFYKGTAQDIPLDSNVADVVMSTYALNEIAFANPQRRAKALRQALDEMRRIARPNAMLVFVDQTGGEKDDWYNLLDAGCLGRGEQSCRETIDVWIEVFRFLNEVACIERIEKLRYDYDFGTRQNALALAQALVPDIATDTRVRQQVEQFFSDKTTLNMEALGVVARLK